METKHTQTEWIANGLDVVTGPHGKYRVAKVSGPTLEETKANAKLIAAAPELLNALISLLPIAEKWINLNHPHHKAAIAAINKATR